MRRSIKKAHRGQALLVSLALILGLTVLVAATQLQSAIQLGESRNQRDYERALQYAEAGLNAYLNMLANGAGTGTNAATIPPFGAFGSPPTLDQFRAGVRDGTYGTSTTPRFIRFPPGSTTSGFCVGHVGTPGGRVTVLSYGYCRGAVRRVRGDGRGFSVFDWAAIWGLRPTTNNNGFAWKFAGSANVVGACGAEGRIIDTSDNFYDGPVLLSTPAAFFDSGTVPVVLPSSPGVPTGHPSGVDHQHVLASPAVRTFTRSLGLPTADQAANEWGGGTTGVEQFRSNNHNATGLRYLVRNTTTDQIRELTGSYQVLATGHYRLDGEFSPTPATLTAAGMQAGEVFYGIRAHPGNYFFEELSMTNADRLVLRTYNDADRSLNLPRSPVIVNDPANPNSGQSGNQNVRFWMGHRAGGGNDFASTFDTNTEMEYTRFASRFRVYVATQGGVSVRGRNTNPPPPFRVNMLCYNRDSSGNGYGAIAFASSTYVFGSLLGWQVDVGGSTTIEKEVPELGPDDLLAYVIEKWTELP